MTARHDIVVIGGGLAGLIAAATAAGAGADVALVEARRLGGRARTSAHDGFLLNQGPHAVYRRGALAAAAQRLGVGLDGGAPALGGAHAWRGGTRQRMPVSPGEMARSRLLRLRSKLVARRLLGQIDEGPAARYAHVSLSQLLADARAPEDLVAFLEMIARLSTYANAPDLLSAEAFVEQYRLGSGGVVYLHGGWQQLIDGFADVARRNGVKILDHRPVIAVRREGGDWLVHTGEGDLVAAAVIIAGAPPAHAEGLLGEELGWREAAGPAVRASCLDLGLSRPSEVPFLLSMDEPYYLSTHAPPARLAPDGCVLVGLARYLRHDERADRSVCEAGLWQHAERAGIDRSAVVTQRYLHDMVVAGGLPLAARGGFAGRPPVVVAERPGLYLAGDWVGDTGMIGDAAAASGSAAALAACARLGARVR